MQGKVGRQDDGGGTYKSISLNPHASDELREHVESDFNTSHGLDDTNRNDEDDGEEDTIRDDAGGGVSRPSGYTSETEASSDEKSGQVPPFRHCERMSVSNHAHLLE